MELIVIIPGLFLLFGVLSSIFALQRGSGGFVWFIVGLVFGPFGLYALTLGRSCDQCKTKNHKNALVCRSCGSKLPERRERKTGDPILGGEP